MSTHLATRSKTVLVIASMAAALVVSGCGSSGSTAKSDTSTPISVAEATASTTLPQANADNTDPTPAPTTTVDKGHQVGIPELRDAVSASDPDLWSHVDFNVTSWDTFNGFNIPVDDAMDAASMLQLCESVSKVVFGAGSINDFEVITIATGVSTEDLVGTPKVVREGKDGTCQAK